MGSFAGVGRDWRLGLSGPETPRHSVGLDYHWDLKISRTIEVDWVCMVPGGCCMASGMTFMYSYFFSFFFQYIHMHSTLFSVPINGSLASPYSTSTSRVASLTLRKGLSQ
ncbi:hypothetical protein BJX65DRAFT_93005 [Aspergillus insuetus]